MEKVKVAICQMLITEKKSKNLQKAEELIREASGEGAKLIVLPEMFNCPYDNAYFSRFAEEYPGESTQLLSQLAKELGVIIIGGSIPEQEGDRIYNTCFIFGEAGELIGRHRKVHLFDIDVKNGIRFKESDTLTAGEEMTVVETVLGKIGVAICYDMRFPELIRMMALEGAQVVIVPAAFNMTTGPAHWEATIKVRALDNQIYFIAASPARNLEASYHAYGHSMLMNPWGDVVNKADETEQILYGDLDFDYLNRVREQLPLLKHRRSELYRL
ncbi:Nitrilase/cyanide hydratase and apolipoprotein N-acyltransferase [Alkaliphilus metalliredigens QYMF]|uniref:Nitrilase/cyanide hydratase and apolipoprotein N-acyltransferase n=1 Tax=Alkaliphilus metalliredigens (strain QYMF) TaxID=293826 RepID=A6TT20_ALKMQ|nr:carbon-nitrogen hydrolase family protein [Alkaliphilus metalliredigens]ABR49338.1 Nitrilase/cyanide hydratase and apolipoprotein N-acyltransferase [Alkaliphilus metalliredigens QYMF]